MHVSERFRFGADIVAYTVDYDSISFEIVVISLCQCFKKCGNVRVLVKFLNLQAEQRIKRYALYLIFKTEVSG